MENKKKPISPQKLAANQANAQYSTGPRREAGKQRSAQNSYLHGMHAKRLFPTSAVRDRDGADYEQLLKGVRDYYQPVGFMEDYRVERIAIGILREARRLRYEQEALDTYRPFESRSIENILRFEAANNRQMANDIQEMKRLQTERLAEPKQYSSHEATDPVGDQSEMEGEPENEDQLQDDPELTAPASQMANCGTNPTPTDSLDGEGQLEEDRNVQR